MKVSVIVPVYNVEEYISRCLESIIQQSMTEGVECIVINDCTSDNSMKLVEQRIQNYHGKIHFRLIHNEINRGIAAVRNIGLFYAQGKYIVYIDSDDYCEHDMIEKMYITAVNNDSEIVISDYFIHTVDDVAYIKQLVSDNKLVRFKANLSDELKGFLWNKLIKKSLFTDNNIYYKEGVNFGEDFLIALQLFYYADKVSYVNQAFLHYMQDNLTSYSRSMSRKSLEDIIACEKELFVFLIGKDMLQTVESEVELIRLRNFVQLIFRSSGQLQKKWIKPYKDLKPYVVIKYPHLISGIYWKIAIFFALLGLLPLYNFMRYIWRLLRLRYAETRPLFDD